MAKTYKIKVGSSANIFHDQSTGVTVCKGQIVEIRSNQYLSKRIQNALNSGHIQLVPDNLDSVDKYTEDDIEKLDKKAKAQFKKGLTIEKIASNYTLEEAKLIAEKNDVTTDESDTVETILNAILVE